MFRLAKPKFLYIIISLLLKEFKKKSWVEIKIINGKSSYKIDGTFKKVTKIGYFILTLESLKKLISSKIFNTKERHKKTNETVIIFLK